MLPTPSWLRFGKSRQQQQSPPLQQTQADQLVQEPEKQPQAQRDPKRARDGAQRVAGRHLPGVRRALANLVQRALSPVATSRAGQTSCSISGAKRARAARLAQRNTTSESGASSSVAPKAKPSQAQEVVLDCQSQQDNDGCVERQQRARQHQECEEQPKQRQHYQQQQQHCEASQVEFGAKVSAVCQDCKSAHAKAQPKAASLRSARPAPPRAIQHAQRSIPISDAREINANVTRTSEPPEARANDASGPAFACRSSAPLAASRGICSENVAPSAHIQHHSQAPLPPPRSAPAKCRQVEMRKQRRREREQEQSVCRLTAKTSDNQCALHGDSSLCAASQSSHHHHHHQHQGRTAPLRSTPISANNNNNKLGPQSSLRAKEKKGSDVRKRPQAWRRRRRKSFDRNTFGPTWPLAKRAFNDDATFGDAEDIFSSRLTGHLFGLQRRPEVEADGADGVEMNGASEVEVSAECSANCNHRRPFAQPFERPTAGWIYNATGAHKINMSKAPQSLKAKLLAASGFRRGSYDDQEGDNDINIILQPSDLHDIEKRAYNSAASARGRATEFEIRTTTTTGTTIADLELAKCLLDQDYNLTVRLFIRKSALNWNFNSFTFDALCCGRSLTELLLHLFDYYDLYNIFNLNIVNVLKCFRLLEFGYHSTNPYHNSIHAADVTQAMHCFIQENKIRKHMTHLETLCSILAAVCHDLDHPGVNQSFLVATNNPLASLYNNNSVLENHHWRFALCIFRESQLFDHFEDDVYEEMKLQLKHLILATDIARQNEYLKRFKDLTSSIDFSMQNTDDRALVLQMALKCADLGNPCRPWLISRVWSNLICDEFYKMGD